jgi:hypothetical protein
MTLQERARRKTIWAIKVIAIFVVFGGALGGGLLGALISAVAVATQPPGEFNPASLMQVPVFVLATSLYGIVLGLPASLLTGGTYAGLRSMRRLWWLVAFGVLISTAWAVLLLGGLAEEATVSLLGSAVIVGALGGVAAAFCYWLLRRWRMRSPI